MKYFGSHGTLKGHVPGLYIVEASDYAAATGKLYSKWKGSSGAQPQESLREIKDEWAKVLSDTIDRIRNRETDYYVSLGDGVYYVEI